MAVMISSFELSFITTPKAILLNSTWRRNASSPLAASSVDDHLLTQTEKNILKEIALGKTTKEIAAEKNLSFHTINSHRKNIFRKLGVNNVHEGY